MRKFDLDLATANEESHSLSIVTNDGRGQFAETSVVAVGEEPWSLVADDLDNDGDVDLAVANSGSNTLSIVLNTSE